MQYKNQVYLRKNSAKIFHTLDEVIPYNKNRTDWINYFLNQETPQEKLNVLQRHPNEFCQQLKHYITLTKTNKALSMEDANLKKELLKFEDDFNTHIVPELRKTYFQLYPKKPLKFSNIVYEVMWIPWIDKYVHKATLLGLAGDSVLGEPDAMFVKDNQIKYVQFKTTTNFDKIVKIEDEFATKYKDTDICVLFVGDQILIYEHKYYEQNEEFPNFQTRQLKST